MSDYFKFQNLICMIVILFVFGVELAFGSNEIGWYVEISPQQKSLIEVTIDCSNMPVNTIVGEAIVDVAFYDQQNRKIGEDFYSVLDAEELPYIRCPERILRYFKHDYPRSQTAKGQYLQAWSRPYGTAFTNLPVNLSYPSKRYSPKIQKDNNVTKAKVINGPNSMPQNIEPIIISSSAIEVDHSGGRSAIITVHAKNLQGMPLSRATVEVSAGGGQFVPFGGYSTVGYAGQDGVYKTKWNCSPCAPGYGFQIKVKKQGYRETEGSCSVRF